VNARPIVYVSKCLGFATCRYNGITINDDFVEKLKPHVDYVTVCPEVEIELGVPRDPVRIVVYKNEKKLVQPATGRDVTSAMHNFCDAFLGQIHEVDGFLLKSRSPSCGIKDVKIYARMEKSASLGKGAGFFGSAVMVRFPEHPVEDEGRIRNFRIREHFLTQLFAYNRFRNTKKTSSMAALVQFHTENKLLLMAYNQNELRILGQTVANQDKRPVDEVYRLYEDHFHSALCTPARYTSNINVLMHAMGHFSDNLTPQEKKYFLASLERYRDGKIPLSATLSVLRSWIIRFEDSYLNQQTFFEPFPEALVEITDSGKGRKLTK
jgi:uncharacterized protein YbgA (DUF1722 family)/uncharacterized protein YbbK (DUF523 family)